MKNLYIKGLRINWDTLPQNSYVHSIPAIKSITELEFDNAITFFVGENGSGKSTLLEAIAVEFGYNSEGGTRNYKFSTYDDISTLSESITLVKGWQRPKFGYFFRFSASFRVFFKRPLSAVIAVIIVSTLSLYFVTSNFLTS